MLKKMSEIKLGDVIKTFAGEFNSGTVIEISPEGNLVIFRPFVHTSNFTMRGKTRGNCIFPYIGIEEYTIYYDSIREIEVVKVNKDTLK